MEGLSIESYIVYLVVSVHTQICGTICTHRENGGYQIKNRGVSHNYYMVTGMFLHKMMPVVLCKKFKKYL